MRDITTRILTASALAILTLATLFSPATARETRDVDGGFTIDIGFENEPAIQADTNALWLRVTEGDQPVDGLEQTLQAEVIYADAVRSLPLSPEPDEPGVYRSVFIPVQPGDYAFRIVGNIQGVAIDETFTSAPEGVSPVDQRIDYEFPSAAQGFVRTEVAVPAAIGLVALGFGIGHWLSRRTAA